MRLIIIIYELIGYKYLYLDTFKNKLKINFCEKYVWNQKLQILILI